MKHHAISKVWLLLYIAAALTFSYLLASFCVTFCTPAKLDLTMNVRLQKQGTVKIFYLEKQDKNWNEKQSVESVRLTPGEEHQITFQLPVKELDHFRLDFQHSGPAENVIKDMELSGEEKYYFSEMKVKEYSDLNNLYREWNLLVAGAGARDPHIVFQPPETAIGKRVFDPFLWGIVFSLGMICFGGLWFVLRKMRDDEKDWFDILLIFLVLVLLCIPALKINKAEISVRENRALAKFPRFLTQNGWINTQFGQQFDSFFNDRFLGRYFLVKTYQEINTWFNLLNRAYTVNASIAEGKNGWFFYRLENSIRNYQNLDVFTEQEMQEGLQKLQQMANWCKQNNIKFYYFIAPDKNKIYGEYMTLVPKVYPDSRSRANLWVDYIRKHSDISVIYPAEELLGKKHLGTLYYKSDTHWNKLGGYFGYQALMNEIKKDFPDLNVFQYTKLLPEPERYGDMYPFLPHVIGKDVGHLMPDLPAEFVKPLHLRQRHHFVNSQGKYKAFMIRDSFGSNVLSYFYPTFYETVSDWQFYLKDEDLVRLKQQKTDIVILLHVERNLPKVFKDFQTMTEFPQ